MLQTRWNPVVLSIAILLIAACSPAPTEAELTATQEALASPTPMVTRTPTPTQTPTVTMTPTVTLTPTPTPLPVVAEPQANDTTRVRVVVDGFQFVLPAGWVYEPPGSNPDPDWRTGASLEVAGGDNISFDVEIEDTSRSPEEEVDHLLLYYTPLEFTIRRTGVTTNRHGVSLAYLEVSGDFGFIEGIHIFHLFMTNQGRLISLTFGGNINAGRYTIAAIQDSIQLTE